MSLPRELPPPSARGMDGWVRIIASNQQEARRLGVRLEELERQLRRRNFAVGVSRILLASGAAGAVVAALFSLPPFHQRAQLAAPSPAQLPVQSAPTAARVTLPVPLAVAARPARPAGGPEPMVQQPSPAETLGRAPGGPRPCDVGA